MRSCAIHGTHNLERRASIIRRVPNGANLLLMRGEFYGRDDNVLGAGAKVKGVAGTAGGEEVVQPVSHGVGRIRCFTVALAIEARDWAGGVADMPVGGRGQRLAGV